MRHCSWIIAWRSAVLLVAPAIMNCSAPMLPTEAPLGRELAGRTASAPQTCVPTVSNSNLIASDASTLVYRSGSTIYVNHPSEPCSAIAPFNTLIADGQAGHYCRGDRIRGIEPAAGIPGPVCILGDWIAYRKP